MKKIFLVLTGVLLVSISYCQNPILEWVRSIGGTGNDFIQTIYTDASGNVYIAGSFIGTVDFDPSGATSNLTAVGNADAFLAKYNSSGALIAAFKLSGSLNEEIYAVHVDAAGSVYVAGYYNGTVDFDPGAGTVNQTASGGSDIFFAKYTSSGVFVWVDSFGSAGNDQAYAIATDNSNNVYVTGSFTGTVDFDPSPTTSQNRTSLGSSDIFIGKYTAAGALGWIDAIGSTLEDGGRSIAVNSAGVYIGAYYSGTMDPNPAGQADDATNLGAEDGFFGHYSSSNGALIWWGTIRGTGKDIITSVALSGSDFITSGYFTNSATMYGNNSTSVSKTSAGGTDIFVAKHNTTNWNLSWLTAVGGTGNDGVDLVTADATNVYLAGYFNNTVDFDPGASTTNLTSSGGFDAFVAKYSSETGALGWAYGYGSAGTEETTTIAVDASSNIYLGGVFENSIDGDHGAGSSPLSSLGLFDGFFAKVSQPSIPTITSFSPASGAVGTAVTITGTNFSTTASSNIVYFGATKATVSSATATTLQVTVPLGATFQPISVTVNGLTAFSSKPFHVTFGGNTLDANSFATKVDFATGSGPWSTGIADFDGDGKADVYVTNQAANNVSVIKNNSTAGNLSFATKQDFATGANPLFARSADLDGDGKQDLVVLNNNSNSISILRNTSASGAISFASKVDFTTGNGPSSVAIADFNGDGKPDIAVANTQASTISLFRNISTSGSISAGSFDPKVDITAGSNPNGMIAGDVDKDGKTDLIVCNSTGSNISIIRNALGTGAFTTSTFAAKLDFPTTTNATTPAFGDFDGDDKQDIAVSHYGGSFVVSVLKNNSTTGSVSLAAKVDFSTTNSPFFTAISDLDGDGKLDFIASNVASNTLSLYRNVSTTGTLASNSFATKVDITTGVQPFTFAVGDLDGDGRPDIVSANFSSNTISVFRNQIVALPTITAISPSQGVPGTTVTITGTSFSTTAANNIVYFGPVKANVTSATATQLQVTVPTGAAYGPITVTVNNLRASSPVAFIPTYLGDGAVTAASFATPVTSATSTYPAFMSIGDIDADAKPDLLVPDHQAALISVFRNISTSGSASLAARVDLSMSNPLNSQLADIDLDGKPDLVVISNNNNTSNFVLSIFRNIHSSGAIAVSSFAARVDFTAGNGPGGLAISDIDMDGKPDIIVSNNNDNTVSVFRNVSTPGTITTGSLAARVEFGTGVYSAHLTTGDIDGDGKPDLAVSNVTSNTISLLRNTSSVGTISFAAKVDLTTGNAPQGITLSDLDKDGKLDIAVVCSNSNTLSIYRNITSAAGSITTGSFALKADYSTGAFPFCIAVGDMDGDARPEIAVTNQNGSSVSLFKNISDPGAVSLVVTAIDVPSGNKPYSIVLNDMDGDTKPDIVVTNNINNTVSIIRNLETAPAAPTITGFNPASGGVSTSVTITGTNFSSVAGDNIVKFNGTQASVSGATSTSIITTVPAGATTGPITVTVYSQTATSSANFTVANLATEPAANPTNLVFTNITSTGFDFSFTAPAGAVDGYLGILRTGASPTGQPTDGVTYTYPDPIGDGTTFFIGSGTSWEWRTDATAGTTYYLDIFAYNGSGSTINYRQTSPLEGSVTTTDPSNDVTAPVVVDNTPNVVLKGSNIEINLTITDASAIPYVYVDYGKVETIVDIYDYQNDTNIVTAEPVNSGGNTWTWSIPASNVGELGLVYAIYAYDENNNEYISPTPKIVKVEVADGYTINYNTPGSNVSNYKIISIPLTLDQKTVNAVIGDDFGDYGDKSKWRIFRYQNNATQELSGTSSIDPGKGYWFISTMSEGITTGPGFTTITNPEKFALQLSVGWNQIGNPYPFNLLWSDVQAANSGLTLGNLRTYSNGSFQDGSILRVYEGGFVFLQGGAGTLQFPFIRNPSAGRTRSNEEEIRNPLDDQKWQVLLNVSNGTLSNELGGFGMHPEAQSENDRYDDFTLPRLADYLEINHQKDYLGNPFSKDVVPTEQDHEWTFNVESANEANVQISWDNSYFGVNEKALVLWDVAAKLAIDMRQKNSYQFSPKTSREFRVYFGSESYVKKNTSLNNPILHYAFPNPVTDRVTFGFSVPESSLGKNVNLEIFDVLGKKISTVFTGTIDPGYHEVTWEGNTETGARPSAGVYIATLKTGNESDQYRLVIK